MLFGDSLKSESQRFPYLVESALLAFINAGLTFLDEGFLELSIWTETSRSGEPELPARIRDAGIERSLEDPDLDHASPTMLKGVLVGFKNTIYSTPVSWTDSQEQVICFISS